MNAKTVGILLFLALIGVGGFYLGQKYKIAPQNTDTGVLPSLVNTATSTPVLTQVPTIDDSAALLSMVKASEVARVGASANATEYTISLIQGNYAKGMASASGGGAIWFAEKVSGTWKLVFIGNGTVQCSDLTSFPDFPKTMIPECWDGATQKLVTR